MQYICKRPESSKPSADSCQIIPCYSDQLDADYLDQFGESIKQFQFKAEDGQVLFLPSNENNSSLLWGLGEEEKTDINKFTKNCVALASQLEHYKISGAEIDLSLIKHSEPSQNAQAIIKTVESKKYCFDKYKSKKATPSVLESFAFIATEEHDSSVNKAISISQAQALGVAFTRDLGNEPGNVCTPSFLAAQAEELASSGSITTEILDEAELDEMGMGAFVSVAKGSTESGKLIIMKYQGGEKDEAPHVLVGKGITFDTGGISLKPGTSMDEMKYDMCGAASVLGTMKAISEIKPKLNIIGVIAAAENMPAGNASKPGDIVTTLSGQTVEILNTDAEGRLVLCDALTYVERFEPASVIDIATLTGACIIALGHSTSAVMSNNEELVNKILEAGKAANDKAWQLPIWDEYQTQIDSPFADMQNIGGKGAGSITAACFLSRFTKKYPWAHLDIAGTAWVSGGKDKGATGRPVPLLLRYLLDQEK